MAHQASQGHQRHGLKLAIDLAPLLVFFAAYLSLGIFWATGALMVATVVSLIASQRLLGRVSPTLIATAALVLGFGALTLFFNDPRFIQVKPTIINLLFAVALLGGLLLKRPVLQTMLGEALRLTDAGWRKLTIRWAGFFLAMAVLNEIVWRNFSETTWASFKVFGILPLTLAFAVLQVGLMKRHELPAAEQSDQAERG
ncbi:MAG TPA: septation protein A [Hyphomicrobiaceae bacterium]|nr:septation protein A [Hyphomicrobiaceae bacterium]